MYTELNKIAIYKWRESNIEEYRDYNKQYQRENSWKYRHAQQTRDRKRYYYEKERKEFLNILLDY
jgi:hypothetical protein